MTGSGSVIDELWVALGLKVDSGGFQDIKRQVDGAKESLLSVGTAVKAFVAGFAIKEVADIGSTFEQNRIQIAGFLSALGQSSDFNKGLEDAAGVIQQITTDAAILPGEAQEYIDVFKAGLPFVQGAMPGGSLADITKFTNQLTAIGKTFGLDSGLIAREFDHMLSPGKGMASLRLPLFRQLLSFMPKMQNGARVTAESFNAMSAPQRLALLQATFEKLQPMLNESAKSFDAMYGAAVSAFKQMTRFATVPLFKGMKDALDQINGALFDAKGNQTEFGKSITEDFSTALKYVTQMLAAGGKLVMWFAKSKVGAATFKTMITLLGTALAGLAVQKTVGSFVSLVRVLTNLRSLLTGGLFIAIALIAEDLYEFYKGGNSVTGMLLDRFPKIRQVAISLKDTLVGLLELLFPSKTDDGPKKSAIEEFAQSLKDHKDEIIAGAATIGVALGLAFAPITTAIVAVTGLITMMNDLKNHKGFWNDRVRSVGDSIGKAFGLDIARDRAQDMGGAGVLAPSGGPTGFGPWMPSDSMSKFWTPGDASGPASAVGPGGTDNSNSHNTVHIHIKSTDPKEAGREVQKTLIRNGQSKVKL